MGALTLQQKELESFLVFLQRYNSFLLKMAQDEDEKLQALVSGQLTRIEHALSTAQANAKQIENLEVKRMELQEQAGVEGMTFSQILALLPEELRAEGEALFAQFEKHLNDVKFRNGKSMDYARAHLQAIHPEAMKESTVSGSGSVAGNAYAKMANLDERSSMLETKI